MSNGFFNKLCNLFKTPLPKPGIAFDDIHFAEKPRIVQRGNDYFLIYRIAVDDDAPPLARALCAKIENGKGYYYFSIPVSHVENGARVEHALAVDGFTDVARCNAVYWLNPDGSEIPLEIHTNS